MKKIKICMFVLLMLVMSLMCSAEEIYIRVGLSFGSSAVKQADFSFANGFQIGYFSEDNSFSPVMFFASNAVTVKRNEAGAFNLIDKNSGGSLFTTEAGRNAVICPMGESRNSSYTLYAGVKYPYYMLLTGNGDGSFNVINYVESEQYIKGVLPSEVYTSWHEEALKAAAVATRTFTHQSKGGKHKSYGVDLCRTTCCQVYSGISKCAESTNKATDETRGIVIVYNGRLITAVYHAISGGITQSAAGAWGSNPAGYPYLAVVETPFEKYEELNYGKWSRFVTEDEMNNLVASSSYAKKLTSGIASITVDDETPGHLNNVKITDYNGNYFTLVTSSQVSSFFSKYVRSANFTISKVYLPSETPGSVNVVTAMGLSQTDITKPVTYLTAQGEMTANGVSGGYYIDGKGYGHGVGMSQHGSQYAALAGYTYDRILSTYYPGTTLTDLASMG